MKPHLPPTAGPDPKRGAQRVTLRKAFMVEMNGHVGEQSNILREHAQMEIVSVYFDIVRRFREDLGTRVAPSGAAELHEVRVKQFLEANGIAKKEFAFERAHLSQKIHAHTGVPLAGHFSVRDWCRQSPEQRRERMPKADEKFNLTRCYAQPMQIPSFPFAVTEWASMKPSEHPGETGTAHWRTQQFGEIRVRMVEYSPGYKADHWCSKGHILFCLAGQLETELSDGRHFTLKPGMSYQCADNAEPHRSSTTIGATLFIVD